MTLFDKVLNKKEEYKAQRMQINNDIATANKLEFKLEVYFLHEKKTLINKTIDDLEEILIELQRQS